MNRPIQQNLIPEIGFTCSGELTRWTIVATTVGGGSRYPELQIWRPTGANVFDRVEHSKFNEDNRVVTNVYEFRPDPPLQFQNGDVLGIYSPPVPRLKFRYQDSGGPANFYIGGPAQPYLTFSLDNGLVLTNHNDVPLVAVDVSNPECLRGFIDLNTLTIKASILSNNSTDIAYNEATQRVVPDLAFACSGFIHSFTVAARDRGRMSTRVLYPEIQLWRRSETDNNEWLKIAGIGAEAVITRTEYLNVHNYTLAAPVEVVSGDIIGVHQPYTSASILRLYQQEGGPKNHIRNSVANPLDSFNEGDILVYVDRQLPLISAEFSKLYMHNVEFNCLPRQFMIHVYNILHNYFTFTTGTQAVTTTMTVAPSTASQSETHVPSPSPTIAPVSNGTHIPIIASPTIVPVSNGTHIPIIASPTIVVPASSAPTLVPSSSAMPTPQSLTKGLLVAIVMCSVLAVLAVSGVLALGIHMYRRGIWRSTIRSNANRVAAG